MSVSHELRITDATSDPNLPESPVDVIIGLSEQGSISFVRATDLEMIVEIDLDEADALVDHLLDLLATAGWHK